MLPESIKAMLHYYFQTKENLYSQVIKAAFEKILKQAGLAWVGPGQLDHRLEAVIDSYMDNYERNPGFLKSSCGRCWREGRSSARPSKISKMGKRALILGNSFHEWPVS